jgi:hypothetical protein
MLIKFYKSIITFFYCGVKTKEWDNVHYEIETAESGKWVPFLQHPNFW